MMFEHFFIMLSSEVYCSCSGNLKKLFKIISTQKNIIFTEIEGVEAQMRPFRK